MQTTQTAAQSKPPRDIDHVLKQLQESLNRIKEQYPAEPEKIRLLYLQLLAARNQAACLLSSNENNSFHAQFEQIVETADILETAILEQYPDLPATLFDDSSPLHDQINDLNAQFDHLQHKADLCLTRSDDSACNAELSELCEKIIRQYHTLCWAIQKEDAPALNTSGFFIWRQKLSTFEEKLQDNIFYFDSLPEPVQEHISLLPPGNFFHSLPGWRQQNLAQVESLLKAANHIRDTHRPEKPCPSRWHLYLYGIGELTDGQKMEAIKQHCLHCSSCMDHVLHDRMMFAGKHTPAPEANRPPADAMANLNDLLGPDACLEPVLPPQSLPDSIALLAARLPQALSAKDETTTPLPVQTMLIWQRKKTIFGLARLEADIHHCLLEEGRITISGCFHDRDMNLLPGNTTLHCLLVDQEGTERLPEKQHPAPDATFSGLFSCSFNAVPTEQAKIILAIRAQI